MRKLSRNSLIMDGELPTREVSQSNSKAQFVICRRERLTCSLLRRQRDFSEGKLMKLK